MSISVIGLDHKTASVEVREQIAMGASQTLQLLQTIAAEQIFAEAMVLCTCNRTEFYFTGGSRQKHPLEHLLAHVAQIKGASPLTDTSVFFRHDGQAAVEHLFGVAASIESQVVGEHEIMGQLKAAYGLAYEARTAGFLFHKLAHWAFRTGKRVMSETALGQGTASVSQAAVDLANKVLSRLSDKTVMLVGAGQTVELAAAALVRAGVRKLVIANRTQSRAQQLADSFRQSRQQDKAPTDGLGTCPALMKIQAMCSIAPHAQPAGQPLETKAISLEDIPSAVGEADLVICSSGSPEPILTHASLAGAIARRSRPILLIDIAVPRDVDQRLADLPNVVLHNIDALETIVAANIERRMHELPKARDIVSDEAAKFNHWLSSLSAVPTIKLLEQRFAAIQQAEIDRYSRKFSAADQQQLAEFARSLCNKIMHDPMAFLHRLDGDSDADSHLRSLSAIREIFRLEDQGERP